MKGAVPPLCGSRLWDRTVRRKSPRHGLGRREGVAVDRILGQILRQAVWDRLEMLDELANNADNRPLLSVTSSELPRLVSGRRSLLPVHAPDPRLRVVSTRGNPDTTPR
jgi:hypothetical protein